MKKAVVYVHGQGGGAAEAAHYVPLFPDCDVTGFDYHSQTPWDAAFEFRAYFRDLKARYGEVWLVANSIGAYFSMAALSRAEVGRAWFISPVVDMERMIRDMLRRAGIDEARLEAEGTIGALSWEYLKWAREHPVKWDVPTAILYGEKDQVVPRDAVKAFAERHRAALTVMPGGEHWFHTGAQMRFLDGWIAGGIS